MPDKSRVSSENADASSTFGTEEGGAPSLIPTMLSKASMSAASPSELGRFSPPAGVDTGRK
eukprot:scaffold475391_cov13-Prasinocladus_malaysianus.AAC.1